MRAFLISLLLVATLAVASFANVIPTDELSNFNGSSSLEAANVTSNNNTTKLDLGEAMAELLTTFQKVMPCGNATLGFPTMAPFRQSSLKVNFSGEHLSLNGDIKNLVVSGLDDFIIIQTSTNASSNRTEFDILYKDIQILGKFDIAAIAEVAGFKYSHDLKGFINLQILNMRVVSGVTIGQNEVGGILLSNMEHLVQVGDMVSSGLNPDYSVAVNNFANQYIRDFSLLFLQTHREILGKMYAEAYTSMVNKALYEVPLVSVTSSIAEAIQLLKSMKCSH